jgi:hypothetical protein
MEKTKFDEVLRYIFAEYEMPAVRVQIVWWDQFKDLDGELFARAARRLVTRKCYGPPKAWDMWEELRAEIALTLPPSLKMAPVEALELRGSRMLLCQDAARFADRVVSPPDGQYDSEEDLARAERIYNATWDREYKGRFERKQAQALKLVNQGIEPKAAIVQVMLEDGRADIPANLLPDGQKMLTDGEALVMLKQKGLPL